MAQPFDQKATCSAAGSLDTRLGEFWLENPWDPTEHNLSAYERNRVLLNTRHAAFADISHACGGADMDSDSRSVVAADFNDDGMPDLLVRSSGGGPLRLFLNDFPQAGSIRISLRGTESNAQGIGARLTAFVGEQKIHREMQTINCFLGQSPAELTFGLKDAQSMDRLEIRWPSGLQQTVNDLETGLHYVITEGHDTPAVR